MVGKSEDNCRQIAVRGRRQIEAKKPRFEASRERREELARRFFDAAAKGDTKGLLNLLAADVVLYGDGGGKAPAIARPVHGADRVVRALAEGAKRGRKRFVVRGMQRVAINGQPGGLFLNADGMPMVAMALDIADGLVQTIRVVTNPEKLAHLGTYSGQPYPGS